MATATPDQIEVQLSEVRGTLRSIWGASYEARIDAIDELVAELTARSDSLADLIDERPEVFMDLEIMRLLDQLAQARVRRRARGT